jgi:hypothetical protein
MQGRMKQIYLFLTIGFEIDPNTVSTMLTLGIKRASSIARNTIPLTTITYIFLDTSSSPQIAEKNASLQG